MQDIFGKRLRSEEARPYFTGEATERWSTGINPEVTIQLAKLGTLETTRAELQMLTKKAQGFDKSTKY